MKNEVIRNCTFEEMARLIAGSSSIFIFPHENADGDAIGSTCALCHQFRLMGKDSWVIRNDREVAANLCFMDKGYTTDDPSGLPAPDLCLAVDASALDRFPRSAPWFRTGKVSAALDHHLVKEPAADYYLVDPSAAASGELVLDLLHALGADLDRETAEDLFAAITTDTGNFQYSNTSARTHRAVAELYETGFDAAHVSNLLFESERPQKILLKGICLSRLQLLAGGRLAMAFVSQEDLAKAGAVMSDSEGIVAELRSIAGVEAAILAKEEADGVHVSFRAKEELNVQALAASFGGGGHLRAAGATLKMPLAAALTALRTKAEEALAEMEA